MGKVGGCGGGGGDPKSKPAFTAPFAALPSAEAATLTVVMAG